MSRVNRHSQWTHDHWPEPFKGAWKAAIEPGDGFYAAGAAAHLAERTRWNNERSFGRYQAFLQKSGRRDAELLPDLDNMRAFDHELRSSLAPYTVISTITQCSGALRAMFPDADLRNLSKVASRLQSVATPKRNVDDRLISPLRLIEIAKEIMTAAEQSGAENYWRAEQFMVGALINAVAQFPLRKGNWQMMIIDKHIDLRTGQVNFSAQEMKSKKRSFEATLPPEALEPIRIFVRVYRPQILHSAAVDQGYLFTSASAGMLHRNTLGMFVKRAIKRKTGIDFNFHLFRHSAATFISETRPEQTRMAAGVLHHSKLPMTNKHYVLGKKRQAFRVYQSEVRGIIERGRRNKARATKKGRPMSVGKKSRS